MSQIFIILDFKASSSISMYVVVDFCDTTTVFLYIEVYGEITINSANCIWSICYLNAFAFWKFINNKNENIKLKYLYFIKEI